MFNSIADMLTPFDNYKENQEKKEQQFNYGVKTALEYDYIILSPSNCWSMGSFLKSGKMIKSYERIGYHACTMMLWCGFVFSEQPIYKIDNDYRVYLFNRSTSKFELIHDNFFSWDYSLSDMDLLSKPKQLIEV